MPVIPHLMLMISLTAIVSIFTLCWVMTTSFKFTSSKDQDEERFSTNTLNESAYTIIDDRCWLNKDVTIDTGLGMVRHPTEGQAGTCVIRGKIPANGKCDKTNSLLYAPSYVDKVSMETINGRSECVIRVKHNLSDADANKYGYGLATAGQMASEVYTSLSHEYDDAVHKTKECESNLANANDKVAYTQSQWTKQIAFDNQNLNETLDTLRAADAQALSSALASSEAKHAQALVDALGNQQTINSKTLADLRNSLETDSLAQLDQREKDVRSDERARYLKSISDHDASNLAKIDEAVLLARQEEHDKCPTTTSTSNPQKQSAIPCISPSNQWAFIDGNLPFHDFVTISASDVGDCAQKCQDDANCTHFSFDNRQNTCWLKTGQASAAGEYGSQDAGGFTSGISFDKYHHN